MKPRAGECPVASTVANGRSGPCSVSRCRPPRPAPTPPVWCADSVSAYPSRTGISLTSSPPRTPSTRPTAPRPSEHAGPTDPVLPSVPASRQGTLKALVAALAEGKLALDPGCDRPEALARLTALPGIGSWTTQMIAMRALGDPDAFPASDRGVRRAAETLGLPPTATGLTRHSESWRPWRAYAVQYLWATTDHRINQWPVAS